MDIYDLYDLYQIFLLVRFSPDNNFNEDVLLRVINVLDNRHCDHDGNRFRRALRTIESLDKELYGFSFVDNEYTYRPSSLKNDKICNILIKSCECLLKAVKEKNTEKIISLADCLHNLPVFIAENKLTIPKNYWKNEVKYYRKKWDKMFLFEEQKALKKTN